MATAAQIAANRENAKLSTGPRTPEGKALSRVNAMKHGLLAEKVLTLEDGDSTEFFELYVEMHTDLDPEGRLEEMLVDRIISLSWRLMRACKIEREILLQGVAQARTPGIKLGEAFRWDASGAGALSLVGLYEQRLERSLFRTLHEVGRLQARRRGASVVPPVAIDLDLVAGG